MPRALPKYNAKPGSDLSQKPPDSWNFVIFPSDSDGQNTENPSVGIAQNRGKEQVGYCVVL